MHIARTIAALVLAVAVALLPASGGAAFAAQSNAAQSHDGTVAMSAAHDTDHATPCDHGSSAIDDCASVSVCALKCFTYAGTRLPSLAPPFGAIRLATGFTADIADSRGGIPPFRPPRV